MNGKVAVIIPTYNAGLKFLDLLNSLDSQDMKFAQKVIIDSSSTDNTVALVKDYGFEVLNINKQDFNHGLSRDKAIKHVLAQDSSVEFVLILTQDVVFETSDSVSKLLAVFENKEVSAGYGRQLTDNNSSLLETASRKFNYPEESMIKTINDIGCLGIYTAFLSDSFAMYRVSDYLAMGGFSDTNFAEDMLLAGKMILDGRSIAYVSEAKVTHSHPYSITSEYRRGVEIAKMHLANSWILERFGTAEARGNKLLFSVKFYLIPFLILEALPKYFGYKITKIFNKK